MFHLEGIGAAAKTSRLAALCLGPNDLAKETGMRMTPGREPFFAAFSLTVAAAKAHGIAALDGPFGGIEDTAGLERECLQGRDFGFDGKTLIHPSQIDAANAAYAPCPRRCRPRPRGHRRLCGAGERGPGRDPGERQDGGAAASWDGRANGGDGASSFLGGVSQRSLSSAPYG